MSETRLIYLHREIVHEDFYSQVSISLRKKLRLHKQPQLPVTAIFVTYIFRINNQEAPVRVTQTGDGMYPDEYGPYLSKHILLLTQTCLSMMLITLRILCESTGIGNDQGYNYDGQET